MCVVRLWSDSPCPALGPWPCQHCVTSSWFMAPGALPSLFLFGSWCFQKRTQRKGNSTLLPSPPWPFFIIFYGIQQVGGFRTLTRDTSVGHIIMTIQTGALVPQGGGFWNCPGVLGKTIKTTIITVNMSKQLWFDSKIYIESSVLSEL